MVHLLLQPGLVRPTRARGASRAGLGPRQALGASLHYLGGGVIYRGTMTPDDPLDPSRAVRALAVAPEADGLTGRRVRKRTAFGENHAVYVRAAGQRKGFKTQLYDDYMNLFHKY